MREGAFVHIGQRGGWTAVLGVAGAAGERGALLRDHAMQAVCIKRLRGNVRVTSRAAIRHGYRVPCRSMTVRTFFYLGMGTHPAERLTGPGIKITRREHGRTAGQCNPGHGKQGDQRGDHAAAR